jgi:hypothetical protein
VPVLCWVYRQWQTINDSQKAGWCKTIEVFQEGQTQSTQLAIFPEDHALPVLDHPVALGTSVFHNALIAMFFAILEAGLDT